MLFVTQSISDLIMSLPNKICKFIDLLTLTMFAIMAHLVFQIIAAQEILDMGERMNIFIEAIFVGFIVFVFRHLVSDFLLACM